MDHRAFKDSKKTLEVDILRRFTAVLDIIVPPVAKTASNVRTLVLRAIESAAPFAVLQGLLAPPTTHVLSIGVTGLTVIATLATTQDLNLFSFHPMFMSVGCLLLMSEGFLVYRNGALVQALDPIMSGSFKENTRSIHVFCQICGGAAMLAGLAFICANKLLHGKSLVPATLHAVLGTCALLLVAVQCLIGPIKAASHVPVHRWHGASGKLTYDLCMLAVFSGAAAFLEMGVLKICAQGGVGLLWLSSALQHAIGERKSGDDSRGRSPSRNAGGEREASFSDFESINKTGVDLGSTGV